MNKLSRKSSFHERMANRRRSEYERHRQEREDYPQYYPNKRGGKNGQEKNKEALKFEAVLHFSHRAYHLKVFALGNFVSLWVNESHGEKNMAFLMYSKDC